LSKTCPGKRCMRRACIKSTDTHLRVTCAECVYWQANEDVI
jgi:hypothetical protein